MHALRWSHPLEALQLAWRRLKQFNLRGRARRNVAHHYDLDERLYALFLDADRQYSCGYFETPTATLDDHRSWIERMRTMAETAVIAGLAVLGLVVAVTVLSVTFATRGAMAANRPIVEVLHYVGATDAFIAGQFQRHFLLLGLKGGLIGGGVAIVLFGCAEAARVFLAGTPSGDEAAALFEEPRRPPAVGDRRIRACGPADRREHEERPRQERRAKA